MPESQSHMQQFSNQRPLFFYTSAATPCPYLPDRLERKIMTELNGMSAEALHDALSKCGFRRSHSLIYTPACEGCSQCKAVRVIANDFQFNKSFRRIMKKNKSLKMFEAPAHATAEQFALFSRYQAARHTHSEMALMGFYEYRYMVEDSPINTFIIEFRNDDNILKGACLVDLMDDGISAVYSFYDPDSAKDGLGNYIILSLIELTKHMELPYLYLGYWVKDSPKMQYKSRFKPFEVYEDPAWIRYVADGH
jgi:arginine-tRNA-protein transferase